VFVDGFEDLGPDGFVVPVVLVTEEGDVRGANFGEVTEAVTAMGDEVAGDLAFFFGEFLFPTGVRLVDLGGADVEALEVSGF